MRGETRPEPVYSFSAAFQSTPLMRGETGAQVGPDAAFAISIHSPHARGDEIKIRMRSSLRISIHSPHARGDISCHKLPPYRSNFNPFPSCEGRRFPTSALAKLHKFQSTPLIRGETRVPVFFLLGKNFNPLPSYEGRRALRSLRASLPTNFNPLPSYEGRRRVALEMQKEEYISIHSPHTRGDAALDRALLHRRDISIHSPHTRGDAIGSIKSSSFYAISIHSPHTRGDRTSRSPLLRYTNFNPLPSYEGRRGQAAGHIRRDISIHSPHTRGDSRRSSRFAMQTHFNPLPSYEGRHGAKAV